jgi:hypothetical protein
MAASSAAPPTMIVTLPTGGHHRVIAEIQTSGDGEPRVTVSCWRDTASGPRQRGRSTEFSVARTSKLSALADAVKQALAGKGPRSPDAAAEESIKRQPAAGSAGDPVRRGGR